MLNLNFKFFYLLFIIYCISFYGCAKLAHLDQLLTLKDLSESGDEMDKYVKGQDEKFTLLLEMINNGSLKQNISKKEMCKTFGNPAYSKKIEDEGQALTMDVYMYVKKFDLEKVNLYYKSDNRLIKWEHIPAAAGMPAAVSAKNGKKSLSVKADLQHPI